MRTTPPDTRPATPLPTPSTDRSGTVPPGPPPLRARVEALQGWGPRRRVTAAAAAALTTVVMAVPTDLIDTPVFTRDVPPTWWSWPALVATAVLSGLLVASYVTDTTTTDSITGTGTGTGTFAVDAAGGPAVDDPRSARAGGLGGLLTFFAVGCPVCNKLVLLALGTSGALRWFEPVQPVLSLAALVLLGWALLRRLSGQVSCPVRPAVVPDEEGAR